MSRYTFARPRWQDNTNHMITFSPVQRLQGGSLMTTHNSLWGQEGKCNADLEEENYWRTRVIVTGLLLAAQNVTHWFPIFTIYRTSIGKPISPYRKHMTCPGHVKVYIIYVFNYANILFILSSSIIRSLQPRRNEFTIQYFCKQ